MHGDYQLVDFYGRTVRDTAVEREQREERIRQRDGEPFTAMADCPKCGALAVHHLSEPQLEPLLTDPASRVRRHIGNLTEAFTWGKWRFDPPGTVVARVCVECNYRWGQK